MEKSGQKRKAEATRQKLLDAALRVIARKGYTSATMDEIVAEAGVSKGLAYYHFKNKAAIGANILSNGIGAMIDSFERIAESSGSATEALSRIFTCFCDTVIDNREFTQFFLNELWRGGRDWSNEMRPLVERLIAVVSGQLERGAAEGVVRRDIDPEFGSVALIGMTLTTAVYYIGQTATDAADDGAAFKRRVYDLASHALRASDGEELSAPRVQSA